MTAASSQSPSGGSPPPTDQDAWKTRADVFEHSYGEALLAIKHQDDKLARSLTAIAFLTAAGVALYNTIGGDDPVLLGSQALSAQTFFFAVFVVSVVFAVAASLAAIGPSTHLGESEDSKFWSSLLFYRQIAQDPEWGKYIDEAPAHLEERLARDFHKEARFIAKRVEYKMARSREAAAFINVAGVSLVLLGVFSLRELSQEIRWWIGAGMLFVFAVLPILDYCQMRLFGFAQEEKVPKRYRLLAISCVSAGILLVFAGAHDFEWWAVGYALGVILTSRLSLISRKYATWLIPAGTIAGPVVLLVVVLTRL
ncbi:MAG: hypothetical protein ABR613_02695 [Actinomycetota bacterium]